MDGPYKGELRIWMGGRSWPVWLYDELPEGVRPAELRDLIPGRPVLYRMLAGPNAGKWASEFVRPSTRAALEARIRDDDGSVYVKR